MVVVVSEMVVSEVTTSEVMTVRHLTRMQVACEREVIGVLGARLLECEVVEVTGLGCGRWVDCGAR